MSSFSSFCKENDQKKEKNQNKTINEAYDELKDLSQDELSQKLYEEVKKQKEEGVFSYDALAKNIEMLKSFIPNETYQNMKNMLEKLK